MKKILVTGANGLLGQKIVYGYKDHPEVELIATGRGPCRMEDRDGYTYESLDIESHDQVMEVAGRNRPDVIINTAAMTNVDACEKDREGCLRANVVAVNNLVTACEKYDIHFIHLSTDFIFDGQDGPYDEEAQSNPISYYGWSKMEAELVVSSCRTRWTIIRTILVIGITEGMSRSNIVLWAKGALEKGETIHVVNDQFRSPTLAEDLAAGCMLAALKGAEGVYNISGKDFMSILELVRRVARFYELNESLINSVSSDTLNQPAKRPPRTGFILDKAIRELGYQPHSFEESLAIMKDQVDRIQAG